MSDVAVSPVESPALGQTPNVLLEWQSPARVFVAKDEKYVRTVLWILLAIGLVLIFFKEFLLYAVFLSLAFVSYVLRTVPPGDLGHKLTEFGLTSGTHSYLWKELKDFWFTQKGGQWILNINSNLRFPPRLYLLLPQKNAETLKGQLVSLISPHLVYRELPPENTVEKLIDSISRRFNLG